MDRKKFYEEQSQLELPTRYAGVIHGILINTQGEIILQKRAENKGHNPGMWDKSFGGHIQYGSTAQDTIQEETIQELGIPCFYSRDENDFIEALKRNKDYLDQIAMTKHIGQYYSLDLRLMGGKRIFIGNKTDFFIGVSNTVTRFRDGEVQDIKTIKFEDLEIELIQDDNHEIYTNDLRSIIKNQRWNILAVLELISEL